MKDCVDMFQAMEEASEEASEEPTYGGGGQVSDVSTMSYSYLKNYMAYLERTARAKAELHNDEENWEEYLPDRYWEAHKRFSKMSPFDELPNF